MYHRNLTEENFTTIHLLHVHVIHVRVRFLPSEIIGSIVNEWPGFMMPTALFSGKKQSKMKSKTTL